LVKTDQLATRVSCYRMRDLRGPHFINVDLEVWSREDLAPFAEAVESRSVVLHVGRVRRRFLTRIESKSAGASRSPERTIWALLKVVETLPPAARRLWKHAESRVFNVGYEGGEFVSLLYERPWARAAGTRSGPARPRTLVRCPSVPSFFLPSPGWEELSRPRSTRREGRFPRASPRRPVRGGEEGPGRDGTREGPA
jgi:hypothetical protein